MKRLNINLPEPIFKQLEALATKSHRNMTDFVRISLGLAKVAIEEVDAGNRLAIVSPEGKLLKEIVLLK
jgi:hypothetical protein